MKNIFVGLTIFASSFANAGSLTGTSEITWLSSIAGDHFVISGSWSNSMNCTNMHRNIWKIYSETGSMDDLQSMYSMALAAYMSGKTVELYSHGCDGGGTNGRPMARSMYLPSS